MHTVLHFVDYCRLFSGRCLCSNDFQHVLHSPGMDMQTKGSAETEKTTEEAKSCSLTNSHTQTESEEQAQGDAIPNSVDNTRKIASKVNNVAWLCSTQTDNHHTLSGTQRATIIISSSSNNNKKGRESSDQRTANITTKLNSDFSCCCMFGKLLNNQQFILCFGIVALLRSFFFFLVFIVCALMTWCR